MKLGKWELISVKSGKFGLDGGAMFGVVPKVLWNKTNPADEQNRIDLATRSLLLISNDRKILVDTGLGNKFDDKFKSIYAIQNIPIYEALKQKNGATIFAYQVSDPERYGVVEFDDNGKAILIEEKPKFPKSNYAVPGLYIYDNQVIEIAKELKPSKRGELEITDVNLTYLKMDKLKVKKIGRGVAWLDTGTPEALLKASNFFGVIEDRQGLKVACIEEIAFYKGFISKDDFKNLINELPKSTYRDYLEKVLNEFDV